MSVLKRLGGTIKNSAIGVGQSIGGGALSLAQLAVKGGQQVQKGVDKAYGFTNAGKPGVSDSMRASVQSALTPKNQQQQTAKTTSDVAQLAAGGYGLAKGILGLAKPKVATTFAERFAQTGSAADNVGIPGAGKNYTITPPASTPKGQPLSSNTPLKSGNALPGDKGVDTTLDMRAGTPLTPNVPKSASQTLDMRTTQLRNEGKIDTRVNPTSPGTIKTKALDDTLDTSTGAPKSKFPWGKITLGAGAVGLGYSALGGEGETPGAPNQSMMPPGVAHASDTGMENGQGLAKGGNDYDPENVWGGGGFEAPGKAPQGKGPFGTGGSISLGGVPVGFGNGGGMNQRGGVSSVSNIGNRFGKNSESGADVEEDEKRRKNPLYFAENYDKEQGDGMDENQAKWHAQYQRKALERVAREQGNQEQAKYDRMYGPSDRERDLAMQERDLTKKIARLTADASSQNAQIDSLGISAGARQGRREALSSDSRASLGPLTDSLALIQTAMAHEATRRNNSLQAQTAYQKSLQDAETEGPEGFTLGEGQQRYEFDPATGTYGMVGQGAPKTSSPNDIATSIEEYEYARSQGYQGLYNDFVNQKQETADTGEKVLSPTEAQALGVPYGTTQSQAYGTTPQKMSGDAAKVYAITQTLVPEIEALKQRFTSDYRGALRGYLMGTDRQLVKLVDQVADKVGRLRSGGAVNRDEEERFKRQIASYMDLPFGDSEQAIGALDGLITEAQQVTTSMNPATGYRQQQYSGGGTYNW